MCESIQNSVDGPSGEYIAQTLALKLIEDRLRGLAVRFSFRWLFGLDDIIFDFTHFLNLSNSLRISKFIQRSYFW